MQAGSQRHALFLELGSLLQDKSTGIVFVTTGNKRSLCLGLADGYIIYCGGARSHGLEAVQQLVEVPIASYAFTRDGDYPFRPRDEVVHVQALQRLQATLDQAAEVAAENDATTGADADSHPSIEVTTRVYRGQVISEPARPEPPQQPATPRKSRTVRYYRGQRIED